MKVLIATASYNRPFMLRQCLLGVKNQSYQNYTHTVNIVSDGGKDQNFLPLYDDLLDDKLIVTKSKNRFIHFNIVEAIKNVPDWESYDLFIKMDDDDVYKKNYVRNIVNMFERNSDIDVVSTKITNQLNGITMIPSITKYNHLGAIPKGTDYKMPMTLGFNKKALDIVMSIPDNKVIANDDLLWRFNWTDNNLKHAEVDNSNQIVWYIHGRNISTSSFLKK